MHILRKHVLMSLFLLFISLQANADRYECKDKAGKIYLEGRFLEKTMSDLIFYEKELVKKLVNASCKEFDPASFDGTFKISVVPESYTYNPTNHTGFWDSLLGTSGEEDDLFGWDEIVNYRIPGYPSHGLIGYEREICGYTLYLKSGAEEVEHDQFRLELSFYRSYEEDAGDLISNERLTCRRGLSGR